LTIEVDYLKFGQVLYNLLDNAIKFSSPGGQVDLEVKVQPQETWFLIKDRGIGIDTKDHQIIFESFRQVQEGANRKYGGAGLGLAITKNLVELHDGRIWLESEIGQGSTFYVAIPHRPDSATPPDSPTGE